MSLPGGWLRQHPRVFALLLAILVLPVWVWLGAELRLSSAASLGLTLGLCVVLQLVAEVQRAHRRRRRAGFGVTAGIVISLLLMLGVLVVAVDRLNGSGRATSAASTTSAVPLLPFAPVGGRHVSEAFHYSIAVPDGWRPSPQTGSDGSDTFVSTYGAVLGVTSAVSEYSLGEATQSVLDAREREDHHFKIVSNVPTTIAGAPARRITTAFTATADALDSSILATTVVAGRLYVIELRSDSFGAPQNSVFDQIVATFMPS